MKENFGPLATFMWFGLVVSLAVAMFIFAALFVIFKAFRKGLKIEKINLPSLSLPRFAR